MQDLLTRCFKDLDGRALEIYLFDDMAPAGEQFLLGYSLASGRPLKDTRLLMGPSRDEPGLSHAAVVDVGSPPWSVIVRPAAAGSPLSRAWLSLAVLLAAW